MNSNMAEVKFNRGTYSKSIVDSLKDGELFFDANTDTTSAAGNQGIYMGVAQADGTVKPVKVAVGVKQYMTILDRAFIRGGTMTDNIYMFTDDTATGLRYAPSIFTGRTGFNLIVGKKGTGSGPFDGRNYSAASMWAGESFGGKLTLNGWTKGIDDLKAGNSFDLSSFFLPNGFDVSVFREGSTTAMDAVVGVFHCKGTYGISHKNGTINDVTGLFIDPNKTTNARVGVVILGKTDDDLLTANGSTVSASGFAKTTDIPTVNDPKITIKMNGAEKGSFTLNQAAAGEVDLGVIDTTIADNSITTSKIVDGAVTSTKLAMGARKPIILTDDTTEVDEETYQKLLSDDVDVVFKVGGSPLYLHCKESSGNDISLWFGYIATRPISAEFPYGYSVIVQIIVTISSATPHKLVLSEPSEVAYKPDEFILKDTLTPVLQEINLTGTDADRKAKLDQFEADWKALTGASDLTGARFVGKVNVIGDTVGCVFNYDDSANNYIGIAFDSASIVYKINIVALGISKGSVEVTPLFSHLEAITIYTDNTPEHKQANLDNIAAYEANLQALGVDTVGVKAPIIPIYTDDSENHGFIQRNDTGLNDWTGICTAKDWLNQINIDIDSGKATVHRVALYKDVVDKTLNTKSLEAITIRSGNTPDDKAANVAAIKAYVDNLKALGIDVTKGYMIPFRRYNSIAYGFLAGSGENPRLQGYMNSDYTTEAIFISPDGTVNEISLQSRLDAGLETKAKIVIKAINEVNALAKSKQDALTSGTNIKTVNGQSLLGSGDITISAGRKSVTIAIAGAETTLTAAQAASFHDPDTDVIIDTGAGLLVTHIYQYNDTGKVVYRMYDGTIMASADTGGIAYMQFYEENNKLTYTTGALPVPIALTSTEVTNIWNTVTA